MDKSTLINKPELLDKDIISSLEYDYNLNVLQDQMKILNDNIKEYKTKIDKIHDMAMLLTEDKKPNEIKETKETKETQSDKNISLESIEEISKINPIPENIFKSYEDLSYI